MEFGRDPLWLKKKALILPDHVPAVAANQVDEEKINILIGGKHGSNMDTMIVAQVDSLNQNVKMVSIPRDIYYNGRKLNGYGTDQIKEYLGTITGLKIDHHMIIDMYAYIEVVDLLGGVDIYLSEPVVDPSYKTFDNGVWSTLSYDVGWHHLSGVQSLRLARSRKTSSDFVRAERQQNILRAIKEKIKALELEDAAQILLMAQAVIDKLETDMEMEEVLSYVYRFRNYEMEPRGVLSTANVLVSDMYVSPAAQSRADAGCSTQTNEAGESVTSCPQAQAAYILQPRNDWNSVRWYVGELLAD